MRTEITDVDARDLSEFAEALKVEIEASWQRDDSPKALKFGECFEAALESVGDHRRVYEDEYGVRVVQ